MVGNDKYARWNIVCGTNGTGKSTFIDERIKETHFKNVLVYVESIDLNGNPFKGMPAIPLTSYRGGKVCIDADTVPCDVFLAACAKKYRNGMIVLDEAGEYKEQMFNGDEPIPALRKLGKQRRKYNVEIYFIYHSASEIPIRLLKWANNIILFHQVDEFRHKAHLIPKAKVLQAAQRRIAERYENGDHYYGERIQLA